METINDMIAILEKGCWKEYVEDGYEPEEEEDYITCMEEQLCPICQARKDELVKVKEIIENKIKKPYAMVGGTVEANHIFREGRKQALREIVGRNNV